MYLAYIDKQRLLENLYADAVLSMSRRRLADGSYSPVDAFAAESSDNEDAPLPDLARPINSRRCISSDQVIDKATGEILRRDKLIARRGATRVARSAPSKSLVDLVPDEITRWQRFLAANANLNEELLSCTLSRAGIKSKVRLGRLLLYLFSQLTHACT